MPKYANTFCLYIVFKCNLFKVLNKLLKNDKIVLLFYLEIKDILSHIVFHLIKIINTYFSVRFIIFVT